jgi:predicted RNase H-like HicB family nuclease
MLTYKSSYKWSDGIVLGEVLDFPGTIAYGDSLDEARHNLASALRDMAETNLLKGEPLPIADPLATDHDADLEEPIHLVLQVGQQMAMTVGATVP